MSETAMMAINRYRLAGRAKSGYRPAILTQQLLNQTDRLLGVILLGNNFVNTICASVATVITFRLIGQNELALGLATSAVTLFILIFSEATPKVIAATHPEAVAYTTCYPLALLLRVLYPAVWSINLVVTSLLHILRVRRRQNNDQALAPDELRLLVIESARFMEKKHHSILLNLFELTHITVDDVMIPRHLMESIDIDSDIDTIRDELLTCHHTRLPVHTNDPDNIIGILHARKVLSMRTDEITPEALREVMRPPYFIPSGTPLFIQLQNFQENKRRMGLVVDEYGELQGLVTLEDILEQIIGEFTTNAPASNTRFDAQADGSILLDSAISLREMNRKLNTHFPIEGPKTLNGLILEYFEDIPEAGTCLVISGHRLEIVQTQDRSIRIVRLIPSPGKPYIC